jgi:hypothetical protein
MKILSKKLQVRFLCNCGNKFSRSYRGTQINTKHVDNKLVKYVFAGCNKCNDIQEIIVYCEENENF